MLLWLDLILITKVSFGKKHTYIHAYIHTCIHTYVHRYKMLSTCYSSLMSYHCS